MKIKVFSFLDIRQHWSIECPDGISFEFFIENYCRQFLGKYNEVHVIVSDKFKFVFK